MTRITGTLHEDLYTSMKISHCILLRMRNVSDKFVEKIKTTFHVQNFYPKTVPFMTCGKIRQSQTGHR